jgi:hypothetical protein
MRIDKRARVAVCVADIFNAGALSLSIMLALVVAAVAQVTAAANVAVCFFGLTRSLYLTAPMIEQRMLTPLRRAANVSVFFHTYNLTVIHNTRSHEPNAANHHENMFLLRPDYWNVSDQDAYLATLPRNFCRRHGDAWHDSYQSHRNFMCQLNSLELVTDMLMRQAARQSFDAVVFARPDVLYYTALDVEQVLRSANNTIYIPPFANGHDVNDRFAFGQLDVMAAYGYRHRAIEEYCNGHRAHAEEFLHWYLVTKRIMLRRTPMIFGRIRATGLVWEQPTWGINRSHNATIESAMAAANR